MLNKLFLSLPLFAALTFSGAALADIDGGDSSAASDTDNAMPHSHPMIPATMPEQDYTNDGAADNDTDNAAANNQPEVPLVSGGVGEDDLEHLKSIQSQYDLKLLITETNGTFLSDITVHIEDKQGHTVADTITDGPILLVKLPAGSYKISASRQDEVKNIKVSVKTGKLRAVQVTFQDTDPRVSGDPKTTQLQ